jgi:hypothetical protein
MRSSELDRQRRPIEHLQQALYNLAREKTFGARCIAFSARPSVRPISGAVKIARRKKRDFRRWKNSARKQV